MEFYWTNQYQQANTTLDANSGTALLVIDYEAEQVDLLRFSRSGTDTRAEALGIAKVFAAELIADRPSQILCIAPQLVFQVEQSSG